MATSLQTKDETPTSEKWAAFFDSLVREQHATCGSPDGAGCLPLKEDLLSERITGDSPKVRAGAHR
jgi:hypothetical protein